MAKATMKLEGMDALQRAFARAPELVAVHAATAVQASTFAVAQRARSLAPVDTGALKDAIQGDSRKTSGRVGLAPDLQRVNGPQKYWRHVEYGTSRRPARPYFRPAVDMESQGFIDRMRAIGPRIERDLSSGRFI